MKYIFLSYLNRSGSTYLANLLSRSPEICVCPEAEILYELLLVKTALIISKKKAIKFEKILREDKKLKLWRICSKQLITADKSCFENFLEILNTYRGIHYPDAEIILFKHNYLFNLEHHFKLIDCFLINLIRDPRGIYTSQKNTISPVTKKPFSRNVLAFSDSWNKLLMGILKIQDIRSAITIRYEDLINETDEIMDKLTIQFNLKERWDKFKLNPSQLIKWISPEYRIIHPYIDELPKPSSINKWQVLINEYELKVLNNNIVQNKFYPQISKMKQSKSYGLYILILRFDRKVIYIKSLILKKLRLLYKLCLRA